MSRVDSARIASQKNSKMEQTDENLLQDSIVASDAFPSFLYTVARKWVVPTAPVAPTLLYIPSLDVIVIMLSAIILTSFIVGANRSINVRLTVHSETDNLLPRELQIAYAFTGVI